MGPSVPCLRLTVSVNSPNYFMVFLFSDLFCFYFVFGFSFLCFVSLFCVPFWRLCMVTHIARVWINRVRLPILHGQMNKENEYFPAFAPENFVSRDEFCSPVSRQPAHLHTQAGSGAYLRDSFPNSAAASIYLYKTAMRHRVSPEFIGSRNCVLMAFTAESPLAQGQ